MHANLFCFAASNEPMEKSLKWHYIKECLSLVCTQRNVCKISDNIRAQSNGPFPYFNIMNERMNDLKRRKKKVVAGNELKIVCHGISSIIRALVIQY